MSIPCDGFNNFESMLFDGEFSICVCNLFGGKLYNCVLKLMDCVQFCNVLKLMDCVQFCNVLKLMDCVQFCNAAFAVHPVSGQRVLYTLTSCWDAVAAATEIDVP